MSGPKNDQDAEQDTEQDAVQVPPQLEQRRSRIVLPGQAGQDLVPPSPRPTVPFRLAGTDPHGPPPDVGPGAVPMEQVIVGVILPTDDERLSCLLGYFRFEAWKQLCNNPETAAAVVTAPTFRVSRAMSNKFTRDGMPELDRIHPDPVIQRGYELLHECVFSTAKSLFDRYASAPLATVIYPLFHFPREQELPHMKEAGLDPGKTFEEQTAPKEDEKQDAASTSAPEELGPVPDEPQDEGERATVSDSPDGDVSS